MFQGHSHKVRVCVCGHACVCVLQSDMQELPLLAERSHPLNYAAKNSAARSRFTVYYSIFICLSWEQQCGGVKMSSKYKINTKWMQAAFEFVSFTLPTSCFKKKNTMHPVCMNHSSKNGMKVLLAGWDTVDT